jgi:hypothetical protein
MSTSEHSLPDKLFNPGISLSLYSGLPYTLTTGLDEFHYVDLDLRWSRELSLIKGKKKDEGVKGTIAVDAFNVLNRVNYVSNLRSPFFGQAVAAQPPRRLQLSFRLKF